VLGEADLTSEIEKPERVSFEDRDETDLHVTILWLDSETRKLIALGPHAKTVAAIHTDDSGRSADAATRQNSGRAI
jgi:hypothetical protein